MCPHGGLNAAPSNWQCTQERGLKVIAITSGENYKLAKPTHSSGKKLGDLADILIDNCCPLEDALVPISGYYQKVGASSTVAVITIAQSIASETALRLEKLGHKMHIFVSPNVTEVPKGCMNEVDAAYNDLVKGTKNM